MFSHLRVHTGFSVVDSTARITELLNQAKRKNITSIALTDVCNLFGAIKFYKTALKEGIKPIFGTELKVYTEDYGVCELVLLAETNKGYKNIVKIISDAYQNSNRYGNVPLIYKEKLKKLNTDDIICLNGGLNGELGKAIVLQDKNKIQTVLNDYLEIFPKENFILEVHKLNYKNENLYNTEIFKLSTEQNLYVVATNTVIFMQKEDFDIHEIRSCINEKTTILDEKRITKFTNEQYFKSSEEMYKDFENIPVVLENSLEIAKKCNVTFDLGKPFLPTVDIPDGLTEKEYFSKISFDGLEKRLKVITKNMPEEKIIQTYKSYKERLQMEIDIICDMGFPGYFLIVEDFIRWSKENNIPVGPGRGSGAGSLVAYSLLITDLDPIPYGLLFERFLNPERVSMPDFDIDFCIEGRDKVIKYVEQKYGHDSVAQIITYGTMAAKGVVRDVVRVLGQGYGFGDRIAKLIPETPGTTFKKILKQGEPLFDAMQEDEDVADVVEKAQKLEGLPRSLGKHAAGIVISPTVISDFSPIYCEEKNGDIVTQFDKNDVEDVGLVKFDFLGLKNLTVINNAVQTINKSKKNDELLDISLIDLADEKAFKLLQQGNTTGVFQLESQGMKEIVKDLQTSNFEEIIALVALYRPGPMENIPSFIKRKHGNEKITYLHPLLQTILQETYGFPIYQEQVMQMAQILAGYTLGGADLLRRAMGKKKPEEMIKQRKIFKDGAKKHHNIDANLADKIFDQMEAFAGYGFNKSHAAAYALIAYQTAWLKAHYPEEYMASLISADMGNTEQIVKFIFNCKEMGLEVESPCVNKSEYHCTVIQKGKILLGLGVIKGLGGEAIKSILAKRQEDGIFKTLFDLCRRVDLRKVNKRALEALCFAGAIKNISKNRATAFNSIEKAIKNASYVNDMTASGQNDLFGFVEQETDTDEQLEKDCIIEEWSIRELLINEKKALGMYFSGHIIDEERHWKKYINFSDLEIAQNPKFDGNSIRIIASLMAPPMRRKTRQDRVLYIVSIDDDKDRIDCLVNEDVFTLVKNEVKVNDIIILEAKVSRDFRKDINKLKVNKISPISTYINENFKDLKISFNDKDVTKNELMKLVCNLKNNINNIQQQEQINTLHFRVDCETSIANFDKLYKNFSIYDFINFIQANFNKNKFSISF